MTITANYKRHTAAVPFGEYDANLVSLDEVEAKLFDSEDGKPQDPMCWQWTFRIAGGDGQEVRGRSSRIYSPKSKSYAWAMALGHPGKGANFNDANILGKPCKLQVGVDEAADGSTFNSIIAVRSATKSQQPLDLAPRPVGQL